MSLKASCSECGATFAMKSRAMEGKKVKCKKCGNPFVVEFDGSNDDEFGGAAMPPVTMPPRMQGVKSKKKKSNSEDGEAAPRKTPSKNKKTIIIASCLFGALLIFTGVMFALSSSDSDGPKQKEVVNLQFTNGASNEHKFTVDYPADWEFKTGGGSGGKPEFIRITAPDISISIKENEVATNLGVISNPTGTSTNDMPDELEPIQGVHDFMKKGLEIDMSDYKEEPAESIDTKAGEGRLSKFEGNRGMLNGGKAWGFRATVPSHPDMLIVRITCESKQIFEKYEDTFRKIILSIGH